MFHSVADLYDGLGAIKASTYVVYFGFLFLVARWHRLADPLRRTRFSLWSTAVFTAWAFLVSMFWAFPQPWGLIVAATTAISVQLAAPWVSPHERRNAIRNATGA
jgi:hypothetical protein